MTVTAIDVHAHALVPAAESLVADHPALLAQRETDARWFGEAAMGVNQAQLGSIGPALVDLDTRLDRMDMADVAIQLVAPMPIYHYWAEVPLAGRLVRATNEGIASLCERRPTRLLGLGTVALQHPSLAAQQLVDAVAMGLRGVQIGTSAGGRELDDPAYDELWAAAADLGAVVAIHPWGCSLGERLASSYLANTVGNPVETTVALSRLIFSGTLDRHPALRLCSVHGGGYLPTYVGRSDHAWEVRPDARGCLRPPSEYLRRIWFDSLVYTPQALAALVDAVGPHRVVLGSDYPFDMGVPDPVARVRAAGLDAVVEAAICSGNARRLLGLDQ